jgi:formamidopyrimidine-DNA glycosylase
MPELPEVEHTRRTLEPHLVGRTVVAARLLRRDIAVAPGDPPGGFSRSRTRRHDAPRRLTRADLLAGERIARLDRRGKQLAIVADSGRALLVHLGMTGHLAWRPPGDRAPAPPHVHATWTLADARGRDAGRLIFRDPRRFGGLWILRSPEDLAARWAALGPDALTITPHDLAARLAATRRPIKAALLDQSTIAGVGNIYADESLFLARIHPATPADRLTADQVAALAAAIRQVLHESLDAGGSTLRDYLDATGRAGAYQDAHRVYGRAGLPCPACGTTLLALRLGQRTTVACPSCQPEPRLPRAGGRGRRVITRR